MSRRVLFAVIACLGPVVIACSHRPEPRRLGALIPQLAQDGGLVEDIVETDAGLPGLVALVDLARRIDVRMGYPKPGVRCPTCDGIFVADAAAWGSDHYVIPQRHPLHPWRWSLHIDANARAHYLAILANLADAGAHDAGTEAGAAILALAPAAQPDTTWTGILADGAAPCVLDDGGSCDNPIAPAADAGLAQIEGGP